MTIIATDGSYIYADQQVTSGPICWPSDAKVKKISDRVIIAFSGKLRSSGELGFLKEMESELAVFPEPAKFDKMINSISEQLAVYDTDLRGDNYANSIMIINPTHVAIMAGKKLHMRRILTREECSTNASAVIGSGSVPYKALWQWGMKTVDLVKAAMKLDNGCGLGIMVIDIRGLGVEK